MIIAARRLAPLGVAALVLAGLTVVAPPAAAAGPVAGSYVALTPTRVLDSRSGGGHLGPAHKVTVRVSGAGVPADASAVAVTITALSPAQRGSLTAATHGLAAPPNVTTLSFDRHRNATGLTVVRPASGRIDIWGSGGRVGLVVDVLGYYAGGTPVADGALHLVRPKRAVRFEGSRIAPGGKLNVNLAAAAGLPDRAGAVAATVTVIGPARSGSLVAYATNTTQPTAPLMDFTAAATTFTNPHSVSQFGVLPISDVQGLTLVNRSKGSLHVVVDVLGWFSSGAAATARTQQVIAANRIFQDDVLPAHRTDAVRVLGQGGVPRTGVSAVIVSARVSGPTRAGALVGGSRAAPVMASFSAGQRVTGQAILRVHNGKVTLRNTSNGRLALEVDVVGYVVSSTLTPPSATSVARYANDLINVNSPADLTADQNLMNAHGVADSAATFSLLDLGAQTITPPLSPSNPGILLAKTTDVRLSYGNLVSIIKAYVDGVATGAHHVTLAVGTNNDGTWTSYRAAARGRQFANRLIDPLRTYGNSRNVTVIGANDIEANFGSHKASDALGWLSAYLANTSADFVYNGALLNCPTVFGMTKACDFGWTQKQYGQLTRRVVNGHNRIMVLPQIYFPVQAVQWANIYAHAGPLKFVGSLTQFASKPTTYRPAQGWAALRRAVQWVVADPHIPRTVDILTP